VSVDGQAAHALRDAPLDFLQQIVSLLHRPVTGHENMERREAAGARSPRAHGMKLDPAKPVIGEDPLQERSLVLRPRGVHQTQNRFIQKSPADEQDVAGHRERDQRIENEPPGEHDQSHPQDHPGRRPDVGEQVLGVRFERDGIVLAPGAHQDARHHEVHSGGEDGEAEPE
jgi:hypothetical protein